MENYCHHDGEQLRFYKKVHIKTEQQGGCSCNFYIARNNLFDKSGTQENVKCHIQHEES